MMSLSPMALVGMLSTLTTIAGAVLLVIWAAKHLSGRNLLHVGGFLLLVGLLLPLIMAVVWLPFGGSVYMHDGGMPMMGPGR